MGAGKSAVGHRLAERLGLECVDVDQCIERQAAMSINAIFAAGGEADFRRREQNVLRSLQGREGCVFATGGGAVLDAGNRALLAAAGHVVYLYADAATLQQRTRHSHHRPLLPAGATLEHVQALLDERDPLYRGIADAIVDTGKLDLEDVVEQICTRLP